MVHFVGAGSGAKDLITVRGMNLLKNADVIIYAGSLVNPELLEYAEDSCEIYNSAYMTLEEIIDVIKTADSENKDIVRLHTGDSSIYGAIREQIEQLNSYDISWDICPGVSSFLAAATAAGCEYTVPGISQSLIITRMEGRTPVPEKEKMRELAGHNTSMAVFLSSGLTKELQDELLTGGYSEDTPCAICYKVSWPDEKIIMTTIKNLHNDMVSNSIAKTALILVGDFLGRKYNNSKLYDASFTTEYRK